MSRVSIGAILPSLAEAENVPPALIAGANARKL